MKKSELIILTLIFWGAVSTNAQESFNLNAGAGIPELVGVSAGMQTNQFQIMLGAGMIPLPDDIMSTVHGDLYFHLFGESARSHIKPWYARTGIYFVKEETDRWIDRYRYLDVRLGRTMFLSEKLSIEVDIGADIELSFEREELTPEGSWLTINFPVIPALGTRLVYRWGLETKQSAVQ